MCLSVAIQRPDYVLSKGEHLGLRLAEIIREVDGNHDKGAAALAEAILSHPGIRSAGLASVVGEPSNRMPTLNAIMQLADNYFTFRGNSHGDSFFATSIEANKDPAQSIYEFARAVLARYGHQPTPAEGEVAELVVRLRRASDGASAMGWEQDSWTIARAADLLEQRHPTPVPVAERLPGESDLSQAGYSPGSCWYGEWDGERWSWTFHWQRGSWHTHWLPASVEVLPARCCVPEAQP